MALNINDQTRIRDYLLGKLSEDEQKKIEERLMVEDDLFEEFEISKDELVEEYYANELTRDEHQWFERNFLASPEGKERYILATAIGHLASSARPTSRPQTFFERIENLFRQNPWLMAASATAAAILIVAAIFLSRPAGQTMVGPTLASNILNREQGVLPTKITIPANASELKFRLLLPGNLAPNANFRAELDNKSEIRSVKVLEHDADSVWVVIPVKSLPRGEYSLKLVAITPDGGEREIPGDYLFNVE
jgi:hypothetical protein